MPTQTHGELHLARVRSACAALLQASGARRVSVWAQDEGSTSVTPLISAGADVPAAVAGRWSRLPVRELGVLAHVLEDRRSVLVEDIEAPGMPTRVCREFGMTSAWVGALSVEDQVLGLLVVEPLEAVTPPLLADHLEVVGSALSAARAWYLAERRQAELELLLDLTRSAVEPRAEAERARELSWQALHDPLTGLPNRALLDDRLATALRATSRRGGQVAVLFVDLHRFKEVNDGFGHEIGDGVLVELASRFAAAVRPADTVGRLAGDEFLVVLPEVDRDDAVEVATRICEVAAAPLCTGAGEVSVGASIGIAFGDHTEDPAAVLRRADAAMYRAKRDLGHGYAVAHDVPAAAHRHA